MHSRDINLTHPFCSEARALAVDRENCGPVLEDCAQKDNSVGKTRGAPLTAAQKNHRLCLQKTEPYRHESTALK